MRTSSTHRKIADRIKKGFQYLTIAVIVILLGGYIRETLQRNEHESKYPPPGELVDLGSHKLHLWCEGEEFSHNGPTIILDSGAGVFSTSWRWVIEDLAQSHRTCAFDRSGTGWSDSGPGPYDGVQVSKELAALLDLAGVKRPFIHAGHSLGAMLGQIYYQAYPNDLAGLVMIEPADPEILIRELGEDRGEPVDRRAEIKACGSRCPIAMTFARLGLVRLALSGIDVVNDPLYHPRALAEFKVRSVRPGALRMGMVLGRYIPLIAFQTGDVETFDDLPVLMVEGSESGSLLGDSDSPEDLENDRRAMREAWSRTRARSTNNLGIRTIQGANHLSLVAYQTYASEVAAAILDLAAEVEGLD